jgi:hypothetical protein
MRALRIIFTTAITLLISATTSHTKERVTKTKNSKALYFSWGYNQEWYTKSSLHVNQPNLGNNYTLNNVKAHDHEGWNNKSIFRQPISIPQYSYRIGLFLNKKQDWAVEINFDHTKYIITDGQYVQLTGTRNGKAANETIHFTKDNGFYYYLNNGANFLLFNVVRRIPVYHTSNRWLALDGLAKAGIGPVIPHVENSFFGERNNEHFQLGGWNAGIETAVRATFFRYSFVEFAQKVDYARFSNLKIANGTARQAFGTYELILTVGVIVPTRKGNPLFAKVNRPKETEELTTQETADEDNDKKTDKKD